ncbi:MAG: hypothetical protein ACJAZX_000621 [Rickettsiales bacterium]|jgi:hypothetical protein
MTKTFEFILILFLTIFSFALGVKYSPAVMEKVGWMFENNDETPLPDLTNTQNPEMDMSYDININNYAGEEAVDSSIEVLDEIPSEEVSAEEILIEVPVEDVLVEEIIDVPAMPYDIIN